MYFYTVILHASYFGIDRSYISGSQTERPPDVAGGPLRISRTLLLFFLINFTCI